MLGRDRGSRLLLAIIVGLYLLCATLWSLTIPPFESPDEPGHARYVNFVSAHGRLPIAAVEAPGEAHQPPLYYLLAAGVSRLFGLGSIPVEPVRNPEFRWYGGTQESKYLHPDAEAPPLSGTAGSLHRLRLLSVAMGAGTILLVHAMAAGAGVPPHLASLAAAFVAFLPQFTFVSATLNNDNLANLLAAGALACLTSALRHPRPAAWLAAGTLAGLGVTAKFTCLGLLPSGLLAAGLALAGRGRSRAALLFLAPAVAIPLPLWLRNFRLLGDPLGAGAQAETLPNLLDQKDLISSYFLSEFPVVLFRSFWGTFGWMSLRMPPAWYAACLLLTLAAATGFILAPRDAFTRRLDGLLGAAVAIQIGQVVVYNLTFTQAQGRFLFPVIGPIALLLASGLLEAARRLGAPALGARGTGLLAAGLAIVNLGVLRLVVEPAYLAGMPH